MFGDNFLLSESFYIHSDSFQLTIQLMQLESCGALLNFPCTCSVWMCWILYMLYKYKFINKYKFGTHYHDYVKWFNIDLCMHVEIDGDIICKLQSWVVIKDILSSQMTEWITGISSLTYPWWVIRKLNWVNIDSCEYDGPLCRS